MKKIIILIFSFSIILNSDMSGQNSELIKIVEATIAQFKCSITAKNYRYYGLSSKDAIENLDIGRAVEHYAVTLRDLQNFKEDTDPKRIVRNMGYVTVPLIDEENNKMETFVMLTKRKNEYQSTGIGEDPDTRNYLRMKRGLELGNQARLVRVPALNRAYIGLEIEGVLNLIPIEQDKQNAEPRPAAEVFMELTKEITNREDVPR